MSHHRKSNQRKSSAASSSSSSSENNLWRNIEQTSRRTSQSSSSTSSGSSTKRQLYPNVPKRSSTINEHDIIQTESQIRIIPSNNQRQTSDEYSSIISASNKNAHSRHALDLITKYTSPQKLFQDIHHRPSLSIQSSASNNQSIHGLQCKRSLSPFNETNQESKRSKSYDEDDDDNELSQLLDHRRTKQISSQNSNTTMSSQPNPDGKQRKPTVRKLSATQQKSIIQKPQPVETIVSPPHETLIIELDIDTEEEMTYSQIINTEHNGHIESEDQPNVIIPSPIKLSFDNCIETGTLPITQTACCTPIKTHIPLRSSKNTPGNIEGRRFSSTSSNSLMFDTPCSSFSRRTTSNMFSTPQRISKNDSETQISLPSTSDMMNELIKKMNINNKKMIYNPSELSKKLFYQCTSFAANNKYQTINSLIKKQFLSFGRYEIEIRFPMNIEKSSTIYACDICLKHFHGSSIAFQRHTAKCLFTQPPGKLVFNDNELVIFQIGETKMNIEQCIYVKSLCRIARLFIDPNKSIDDTKIDRFTYYILCRRDPIASQFQGMKFRNAHYHPGTRSKRSIESSLYRFVGYFSKQLNQYAQQLKNNLSCLFILPSFAQNQEYNQLLIAFSYHLTRSDTPTYLMYNSPARPLDNLTLSALENYWRGIIFACLDNYNHSSVQTIALDTLAQQTNIHPRDILLTLYTNGFIIPHPTDKSSVYLRNKTYHFMTTLKTNIRKKLLFMDMKLTDTDNENQIIVDQQNNDKKRASDVEEIVLD